MVLASVPFLSFACGDALPVNMTNPYLIPPLTPDGTQFLVFHGELKANYTMARTRCVSLGGELADIDSLELLHHLASRLHGSAFILGFLGDSFGEDCVAAYPGSAIAIPEASCGEILDSICEISTMGTGSIQLDAQQALTTGGYLPPTSIKDIHVVPHGLFTQVKDSRQNSVTSTVQLMGSIATNPVLPCCRCCE